MNKHALPFSFLCLCPLCLAAKLNIDVLKTVYFLLVISYPPSWELLSGKISFPLFLHCSTPLPEENWQEPLCKVEFRGPVNSLCSQGLGKEKAETKRIERRQHSNRHSNIPSPLHSKLVPSRPFQLWSDLSSQSPLTVKNFTLKETVTGLCLGLRSWSSFC